jgi:hypothetical protein
MKPEPGEIWQHFKGKKYRVLHIGLHTETQEELVVYQHEPAWEFGEREDKRVWVRPMTMWLEKPVVKGTQPGEYNCLHSMQSHVIRGDDLMHCEDCEEADTRFYRVQEVEYNPGVMEPPSFEDPSIVGMKGILKK